MVAFSRLPDACQLALFKQLPLKEQLRFRSVCHKWDTLIPIAAGTRRSLIIVIGETRWLDDTDFELQPPITIGKPAMHLLKMDNGSLMFPRVTTAWDCLKIARPLPKHNGHLIASTFTGVSTLKVIIDNPQNPKHFKMIIILLQLWRHQLTSFHLHDRLTIKNPSPETTRPFYAAINSLSSLKRLVLNLNTLLLGDLPVIAHLEELDIICAGLHGRHAFHNHDELATNLQKYGQSNRNLIQVGYTNAYFRYKMVYILEDFTSLSGHLRKAFTRLEVKANFRKISQEDLPFVCNHFQNLMTLDVNYSIEGLNGLVPLFYELSKLRQLIYLSLRISIHQLPIPNAHHPLSQLPSVKVLVLALRLRTPQHMAALDIGGLFPNLQVIEFELRGNNFLGCGFNNVVHFPNGNLELAKECLRQVFRPLKRRFGDKLTVLHDLDGIGSAEELLATF